MTVQYFTPEGLLQPAPYHHVSVATGTRHVHVAGQVAWRPDGAPTVPEGLSGQVAQALRNTATGLAGAGATFADVVRLTFYVVGWRPEMIGEFMAGIEAAAADTGLSLPMPPASLIGVDVLFDDDTLVEVEATAILP